jgi:hypothetical protein
VGGLLEQDLGITRNVFEDVLKLQEVLTGKTFDREVIWQQLTQIFQAEPGHGSRGRSASKRLQRALQEAEEQGIVLPTLLDISRVDDVEAC